MKAMDIGFTLGLGLKADQRLELTRRTGGKVKPAGDKPEPVGFLLADGVAGDRICRQAAKPHGAGFFRQSVREAFHVMAASVRRSDHQKSHFGHGNRLWPQKPRMTGHLSVFTDCHIADHLAAPDEVQKPLGPVEVFVLVSVATRQPEKAGDLRRFFRTHQADLVALFGGQRNL